MAGLGWLCGVVSATGVMSAENVWRSVSIRELLMIDSPGRVGSISHLFYWKRYSTINTMRIPSEALSDS